MQVEVAVALVIADVVVVVVVTVVVAAVSYTTDIETLVDVGAVAVTDVVDGAMFRHEQTDESEAGAYSLLTQAGAAIAVTSSRFGRG
jgi:hypothetical protein